jgi:ATP-dependent Lhr-like helicase
MAGDVILLGNSSWRIRRVEPGRVRVEDAPGAAPTSRLAGRGTGALARAVVGDPRRARGDRGRRRAWSEIRLAGLDGLVRARSRGAELLRDYVVGGRDRAGRRTERRRR